MSQRGN